MDVSRRKTLRAIGTAGIVGAVGSSVAVADDDPETPFCDACPDGTDLLAKYDFDGEKFVYDGGECDAVDLTVERTKGGDSSEPARVSFTSELFYQGLRVKTGSNNDACDSVSREVVATDDNTKDGQYEGVVDITQDEIDEVEAISYIAFCAATCFQVDFVFGDPISDLGPDDDDEGFYSARKLVHKFGNTYTLQTSGTQGLTETRNGCTVETEPIQVDFEKNEATVSFRVTELDGSCTLSLVSYVAPCPIGFTPETADRQHALDATTKTIEETGSYSFTGDLDVVQLPTAEHLDSVCSEDSSSGTH